MSAPVDTTQRLRAPLDGAAAGRPRRQRPAAPLAIAFIGYPVLWLLGAGLLAFPLAGAVALAGIVRRRGPRLAVPPPVAIWFAFLAWTLTAVFVLDSFDRVLAYVYRGSFYFAATGLLLWVVTSDERVLPDRTVLRTVSALWFATVIGGLLAVVAPGVEITTVVERMLPDALLRIELLENIVHLQIADESRFLGVSVGRPEAPFPFTNPWGANLALLTPVALATIGMDASRRWRLVTGALAVLAVIPWALSLNRGSWLSLSIGLLYVGARQLRNASVRVYIGSVALAAATIIAVLLSPLGALVTDRVDGPGHSDVGRTSLYEQALDLTVDSPLIGYGAPQPNQKDPTDPSIGTHGQLWLLLVSHGVPAALLYVGFFAVAFFAAVRWRARHAVWLEAVLLIGAVQFPVYELVPTETIILAVVAAVCIRGYRRQRTIDAR